MGSHQTPRGNGHGRALRVGEVAAPSQKHQGVVGNVAVSQSTLPETYRRLSGDLSGAILQARWSNHVLQPTPWIAVAFPSFLVRRG